MNLIVPPPVPPDEETDGLLRAFYRAQMPHPWPDWKAPADRPLTTPVRPGPAPARPWRSRLALAASVALLALSTLLLHGKLSGEPRNMTPNGSNFQATRQRPWQVAPDKVKSSLNLEQPKDGPTKIKVEVQLLPMK
jgi:hypothetical protein